MDQKRIQAYRDEQKRKAEQRRREKLEAQNSDKITKALQRQTVIQSSERKQPQDVRVVNQQKVTVEHKQDNKPLIQGLDEVKKAVAKLKLNPTINVAPTDVTVPEVNLQPLLDAIKKLEMNPVINVAQPEINIPETKVDLSPIVNALPKPIKRVSIEDFRAQDMDEEEQGIQYVGFVAPNGNWFIIRNDVEGNNMRYKFGKKDYEKAWPKLATYKYQTLDKAYNEIKT